MKKELSLAQKIVQGKVETLRKEQARMNADIMAATKKNKPSGNNILKDSVNVLKDQQVPAIAT